MLLWDLVSPADLTVFSRRVPDDLPDSLSRFLPNRSIVGVKSRTARFTRTNVTAMYRAYNAETPIGKRPDVVRVSEFVLPPVGQKLLITEWEYLYLQYATSGGGAAAALIQQIYDDVEQNTRAIRNRIELARGQLLCTGKFSLVDENNLTIEADYGLATTGTAGTHTPTSAVSWSDTTNATPLTDEQTWTQTIKTDSGAAPVAALMADATVTLLARNAEYRAAFWGGLAGSQPNLSRAQVNQIRSDYGLAPIQTYDHRLSVDGVDTRVTDVNKVVLVTANAGETQFGITADSLQLVGSKAVDFTTNQAPGIFSALYKNTDPVEGWTKSTAVAMPILGDPNGLVAATAIH